MADSNPAPVGPDPVRFSQAEVHPSPPKMHSFNAKFPDASGITAPPAPDC